ncbi:MAG: 1-phosphofructokinase [Oscillospiraceae bacterium]|nr:1-phosphofructokinase [Oscillospiraceae bacterium]
MIYTVTFNPAVDYVVQTGSLQPGCVNRAVSETIRFGGKGINVSLVLAALDVRSVALGFTAGFTGEAIERGVQEMGVETDFVHLKAGFSRINVKLRATEETEINGQGPAIDSGALAALFEKLDALSDGDTLVLAGSIPNTLPQDIYETILRRLSGRSLTVAVDATGELLLRVLRYRPFLIKPNHHELGALFGKQLHTIDEILCCARQLQEQGARHVLVSMAGEGAVLLDEGGGVHRCGAAKGTVRNSVGAGDSMVAGFLAGCAGGDLEHALRLGTACGGATAFSEGLASRGEIEALLRTL